ncbi:MAG: isocitrate lyase/phosphoenolpyruvate mutase family protein [Pseudomonadota bacterium]
MTQDDAKDAESFLALHHQSEPLLLPNPWDIGSAKILEKIGFKALATTSGGFAWSIGKLDGAVSLEEKLEHCRALCDAVDIPVAADLGSGFGAEPKEIAATVTAAGATGLAGVSIEDAANPYFGGAYDTPLATERVAAAVEAARALPGELVVTARCEHFSTGDRNFDDCLARLKAYEDAGADVLHAPGMTDLDQIKDLCAALEKPVNVLIGFRQMPHTAKELGAVGVKRISLGTDLARIAYGAAMNAAKEFLETGAIQSQDVDARSKDVANAML